MNISITISKEIKDTLNTVRLGILSFNDEVKETSEAFWTHVELASDNLRQTVKAEDISKISTINETRIAYKKCGKDPSRYRPSADSLIRRIVKGNDLYKVNGVVDALNLISLKSGFSIGGYDLSKIKSNPVLSIGTSDDLYEGIGRGELNIEGLPVLRDSEGVFGSPTSDSKRTMISTDTKQIGFVFFDFGISEKLEFTIEECKKLLEEFCEIRDFTFEEVCYRKE